MFLTHLEDAKHKIYYLGSKLSAEYGSIGYVCVVIPFILEVRLVDAPAGVTQEGGHTGFLIHLPSAVRALILIARRIQPSLSLVDREVYRILCTHELIVLHLLGIFLFSLFFVVWYILVHRQEKRKATRLGSVVIAHGSVGFCEAAPSIY